MAHRDTQRLRSTLLVPILCVACGCGQVAGLEPDAGDDAATDGGAADPLDDFFSLTEIHTIDITVDDAGVAALLDEPKVYTRGAVTIDDTSYAEVGVRLKGSAGSFVALDGDYPEISGDGNGAPGKSAFILDFNRYVSGQKHLGLAKLTINNMVQDPSGIHEQVGYALFRAGGVPAPRTGYARVSFNGELRGLYALIESPDNREHLTRWFSSAGGNLYEGSYGTDLQGERWIEFDQDAGDDQSLADLSALVAALDAIGEDDDPGPALERYFDLDEFTTFAATELFLGHWDGYAWSANNYMLYHDLGTDRWSFLPWGIDQLFGADLGRFAGVMVAPGPSWAEHGGRIQSLCVRSPSCRARLASAWQALLDRIDEVDLAATATAARQLAGPVVRAEAEAYGDPELTDQALDQVDEYLAQHPTKVAGWLPCLVGDSVDGDADGYDDCTVDCRPDDPSVSPGATEQCNFRDDDCNGVIDDPEGCPRCAATLAPSGVAYQLCVRAESWSQARQRCIEDGRDLASIHDQTTADHLVDAFLSLGVESAWIGLEDQDSEGTFEWCDGSPVDFDLLFEGEPNPERDCVAQHPGGWTARVCGEAHPFVCK